MRQVIVSRCLVCDKVIGCYDSAREEKKQKCDGCAIHICPSQTQFGDSHGLCDEHLSHARAKP